MKAFRKSILSIALILVGFGAAFSPQPTYAAGWCTAFADEPYLDGIKQNVVIGGGWYCGGGYSSDVHIGIKVLTKTALGDYYIIYTDSYWVYDNASGSYYSSVPVSGCSMWYKIQFIVDGNLGWDSDYSSDYLSACAGLVPASPTLEATP